MIQIRLEGWIQVFWIVLERFIKFYKTDLDILGLFSFSKNSRSFL